VDTPVPGNVDEPRELAVLPRTDPAQAVAAHLRPPVIVQDPVPEALSMQEVQFGVRKRAAPQVIDHRATLRSGYAGRLLVPARQAPCVTTGHAGDGIRRLA